MILVVLALAGPALFALLVTLLDALTWPRGERGRVVGRWSILVPARDEERSIEDALRAACAQPTHEILVYDDQSRDATASIVDRFAQHDPRVRRIAGVPLPAGWVGKVHACAQLATHASGEWLLYVDADVRLEDGALERLSSLVARYAPAIVTAVPRQIVVTPLERLIVPLLHLIYTSWLPATLVWWSLDPRMTMANGQVLAIRRDALEAIGGWSALRAEVVDDMAICTAAKREGQRVLFADGHELARCRMYRSGSEVWAGFTKNLFEGLGERVSGLALAIALHLWAFVAPLAALALGAAIDEPALLLGGGIGAAANLAQRAWLTLRHRQPLELVVLQPLAVLVLSLLALDSWRRRGRVEWRGRVYAARSAR